jgi:hypothetical protein
MHSLDNIRVIFCHLCCRLVAQFWRRLRPTDHNGGKAWRCEARHRFPDHHCGQARGALNTLNHPDQTSKTLSNKVSIEIDITLFGWQAMYLKPTTGLQHESQLKQPHDRQLTWSQLPTKIFGLAQLGLQGFDWLGF